jgi:hypothetical protein
MAFSDNGKEYVHNPTFGSIHCLDIYNGKGVCKIPNNVHVHIDSSV